jgi:4-amino-4-deoxy-L-arabinose transferase-like glycosyltransferase
VNPSYRTQLGLLLLAGLIILLAGIGLRDPWPADEPRFALIAKDMVESGSWLFPRVGGVLYPDKPPVFFWIVAALYSIVGSIKVAILLPGVIAGLGVLLLVTDLARRLRGEQTAICTGALLLVMIQFPLQMKTGQIDGFLCLLTTLGLYGLCRHLLLGPDWRWLSIGAMATGLGVITKGVGFLPLLVLIPYAFARRRGWPVAAVAWTDRRWLLLPAGFLVTVGVWLVPMLLTVAVSDSPDLAGYRDNILFHQTVTRYADSWGHIKPPWYLFTNAAPWLWLPVTLLLPWLVPRWRQDLRHRNSAVLLLGGWALLVLLFFSMSDGKRSLYIFPAAPAIALLAGFHVPELIRRAGVRRLLFGLAILIGTLVTTAAAWVLIDASSVSRLDVDPALAAAAAARAAWIGGSVLLAALLLRVRYGHLAYASAVSLLWIGIATAIYPLISDSRSGAEIIARLRTQLPAGATVAFAGWPEQFLLQWDDAVVHFGYRRPANAEIRDATEWLLREPDRRLLVPGRMLTGCYDRDTLSYLGHAHRRDWFLADSTALTGACPGPGGAIEEIVHYAPGRPRSLDARQDDAEIS